MKTSPNKAVNIKSHNGQRYKAYQGFTIIELVLVIIVIGILAVTVAPKMFNSDGFDEYAYQGEVISVLRNIQLRAMQQTEGYTNLLAFGKGCHTVVVTSKKLTLDSSCNIDTNELNIPIVEINNNQNLSFSPEMTFSFDAMGRPSCNTCTISINGVNTLTIVIESEGFIHAQ